MGKRWVFLGAPGVGKGTQAEIVAQKFGVCKISTGDLLREAVTQGSELGQKAQQYMDRGELVPDEVVMGLVQEKIATCLNGFVLDGFPRTVKQADLLASFLEQRGQTLDQVVYFSLSQEEIIRRLTGRRICTQCQAVYHLDFSPPRREGVCDRCGGPLQQRRDDQRETVSSRLSVYEAQTAPLIAYYRERQVLAELDSSGSVETVRDRLLALLNRSERA
ncbi:MAG: adenylate kinase [Nitrospirae bacterium]|nr:MAG: adenylate kinase [Nitrospirota bacterium]